MFYRALVVQGLAVCAFVSPSKGRAQGELNRCIAGRHFRGGFQRIDREVKDVGVPQQLMVAKLGLEVGF